MVMGLAASDILPACKMELGDGAERQERFSSSSKATGGTKRIAGVCAVVKGNDFTNSSKESQLCGANSSSCDVTCQLRP